MRKLLLPVSLTLVVLAILSLRSANEQGSGGHQPSGNEFISANSGRAAESAIVGCAPPPDLSALRTDAEGRFVTVLPGWGHYSYRVRTNDDSAQFFFDQGLNMYYSYHLAEAFASFEEAARRDPACAMAYWGQALSMGPYYNQYAYKMPATVLPVLEKMNAAAAASRAGAGPNSPVGAAAKTPGVQAAKEKDLIAAMNSRYSADISDSHRKELNLAYSENLSALIKKYPADDDIKALYVDAVMLEHVWDFWENDGTAKPWTAELVTYCDQILADHPTHPAALHYQIHLVEASLHPEKALHNADRLVTSMPGVSHMVHMSSHMYQRNGLYAKGVAVNETASRLALGYDSMAPYLKLGKFVLAHYNGVATYCAMNANMYTKGMESALRLRTMFSTEFRARLSNAFFQYLDMMPLFVCIRSGKWSGALAQPAPDSSLHYAVLLDNFGKGLASLRLQDGAAARLCLQRLRSLLSDSLLQVRIMPFNRPVESAKIAESILAGEIAFSDGKPDEALRSLEEAVSREDNLIYSEPKYWPMPARHFLGACLMALRRPAEAEAVYRKDLVLNPDNGWSLLGLYQSLFSQGKTKEAEDYKDRYRHAFADAGEMPPASVY